MEWMDGHGTGLREDIIGRWRSKRANRSIEWAAVRATHGAYVARRWRGAPMGRHAFARALDAWVQWSSAEGGEGGAGASSSGDPVNLKLRYGECAVRQCT